jgi:hypothetical protein
MAAQRPVNFQHSHRESNRKPQTHTALAAVNRLNTSCRGDMHVCVCRRLGQKSTCAPDRNHFQL